MKTAQKNKISVWHIFECQISTKTAEFAIFMEFAKFTGIGSTVVLNEWVFTCLCKQPGSIKGVCLSLAENMDILLMKEWQNYKHLLNENDFFCRKKREKIINTENYHVYRQRSDT